MLSGYRSVGDVTLDCGGEVVADIGWVIFEVADSTVSDVRGIISTYNDSATYTLVRLARAGTTCRLRGRFDRDSAEEYECTLDNAAIENMLVQDTTATVAFRATARRSSL